MRQPLLSEVMQLAPLQGGQLRPLIHQMVRRIVRDRDLQEDITCG